ncbi:MAG: type II secretion system minor pseudopilin GspK [Burkholderiaceae bacterium]|jgi:general secretion pathway protein K|nr:type II secretion system minor pseudopilin GspK [Burkholderiaceae bacterium]
MRRDLRKEFHAQRSTPGAQPRQRGAALLAAMITVALVATLAAAALWRQWRGVEVESAERARVQSSWILTGALDWGRLILAGDQRESSIDHLAEPWAVPLAEARLSTFLSAGESSTDTDRDAFLSGQITDLQSRLNVMNLVLTDKPGNDPANPSSSPSPNPNPPKSAYSRFLRLFGALGLRTSELDTLTVNLTRAYTAMQSNTVAAGDAPLLPRRFEQLAWLGVSPETLQALRPYVTVLPISGNPTPVNLNTASALVIYAALPDDIDLAGAQRLVAQRDRSPFQGMKDVKDALASLGTTLSSLADQWIDVKSSFFEIRGRLRLDDVALEEVAVVRRLDNRRGVITLWRERAALTAGP